MKPPNKMYLILIMVIPVFLTAQTEQKDRDLSIILHSQKPNKTFYVSLKLLSFQNNDADVDIVSVSMKDNNVISFFGDSFNLGKYKKTLLEEKSPSWYDIRLPSIVERIGLNSLQTKKIIFEKSDAPELYLNTFNVKVGQLEFGGAKTRYVSSSVDTLGRIDFINSDSIWFFPSRNTVVDTLVVEGCNATLFPNGTKIPKLLYFNRVKNQEIIDLTLWGYDEDSVSQIAFFDVDIEKFKLNYKYFKLRKVNNTNMMRSDAQFQQNLITIRDMQKKYGYLEGLEKIEKEITEFKYVSHGHRILNWIDKHWWDYGYNKGLIFRNSLFLMFFFFVFNFVFYKSLTQLTYKIEEFTKKEAYIKRKYLNDSFRRHFFRTIYIFLYTGFVFWGLRLDVSKIKFDSTLLALYIIIQYLVGIICLAYLANYIISK